MSIVLKTPDEIEIMRQGGKITAQILKEVLERAKPGVATKELDEFAQKRILALEAYPSFKTVRGYKFTICTSVNDEVVHGLPGDYILKESDVLGVDLGVLYQGYHTDAAWTVIVGGESRSNNFLETGKLALKNAIEKARVGNCVGDVSQVIQKTIEEAGFSPVRALTGHGIGKKLHEPPLVPCFGRASEGLKLEEGAVLAIEVIYNMGKPGVVFGGRDPWTVVTEDSSLSSLFEQTVAVTRNGPQVLTEMSKSHSVDEI